MNYPDSILSRVQNPAQYIGNEYNIIRKSPEGKVNMVMSFPDLYSIGMSSYGHRLLYQMFNKYFDVYAQRVYAVEGDMEKLLKEHNAPLCALDGGMPVGKAHFLGFTVESELCYSNILQILELSGIPLKWENRDEAMPIVCAGGTAVYNPLPLSPFIDVFFIGEAEAMSDDIVSILRLLKSGDISRGEAILRFDELPYTYVPQNTGSEKDVEQVTAGKINSYQYFKRPLVPISKTVHDRAVVELSRGCTRGCRFCQAGYTYRPVRQTPQNEVIDNALCQINATGYRDVSLLSLSATDYTNIGELLVLLNTSIAPENASVSLPSLRVGTVSEDVFEQLSSIRKSGITIAVETASERMKKIINKNISYDEIIQTIESGVKFGWKHFKLYFMIGLPYETDGDALEIAELVNSISRRFRQVKFNVSISPFVPRPFTPFQWSAQASIDTIEMRLSIIREHIHARNADISSRDPHISYLEGAFARGDDSMGNVLLTAYEKGARLDQWSEYFNMGLWKAAAEINNVDMESFMKSSEPDTMLPWDFIHTKVKRGFLEREFFAAERMTYTEDCRELICTQCGACKGEIAGERRKRKTENQSSAFKRRKRVKILSKQSRRIKLFFTYTVSEDYKYISHLSMIGILSEGMRRSGIDFLYTQGFNPKIKAVYGPPKPVGVYSDMEILEAFVQSKPDNDILSTINRAMPEGIKFTYLREMVSDRMSVMKQLNRLSMIIQTPVDGELKKRIEHFNESDSFTVQRDKNNKTEDIDIRPFIDSIEAHDGFIRVILMYNIQGGVKFDEMINSILKLGEREMKVKRERFYRIEDNKTYNVEEI